jgi:L-asparaginase II
VPPVPLVRVIRSGVEESVHLGSVAVVDGAGRLVASAGDPERVAFARSSMKPLQAAVAVGLSGRDLPDREVAVMCASHNGEPVHVEAVRAILDRAGLGFDALQTPPDRPLDVEAAAHVPAPGPEFHNCSGKHAGMLLACVDRRFDVGSYRVPGHPLQEAVGAAVADAAGRGPVAVGVDGCGVPVHALPLRSLARLYAALGTGAVDHGRRVLASMRAQPYLVGGRNRACTVLMERTAVAVKVGAEGLMCAAAPERDLGVALKIEDGASRAAEPAMARVLELLELLDPAAVPEVARPPVLGGGRPVGELVAGFTLEAL